MSEKDSNENKQSNAISGMIAYNINDASGIRDPRPPKNFQDLLRYSTELSTVSDANSSNINGPLDEESKQFLSAALSSLTTDVIAEMKTAIETIDRFIQSTDFSEEECDECFENLLELICKIDFAIDFHKIGGYRIFTPCLLSQNMQLRWRICEVIAELCQNNPYCQDRSLEEGYLKQLLTLVELDPEEIVRVKSLYAISCIVRENEKTRKEFIANNGLTVLLRSLNSKSGKLKIKASFLLSSLCSRAMEINEDVPPGTIEQLVKLTVKLKGEYLVLEHLISALLTISPKAIPADKCVMQELQLKNVLQEIISNGEKLEEATEARQNAQNLLRAIS